MFTTIYPGHSSPPPPQPLNLYEFKSPQLNCPSVDRVANNPQPSSDNPRSSGDGSRSSYDHPDLFAMTPDLLTTIPISLRWLPIFSRPSRSLCDFLTINSCWCRSCWRLGHKSRTQEQGTRWEPAECTSGKPRHRLRRSSEMGSRTCMVGWKT